MARTEALQLRGEREAALGRLHAALEASHTLRCESPLHLPPTFSPPLSHPLAPRHPSTCTLLPPTHPPLRRESGRQLLAVQTEREIATSCMRSDRDTSMRQVTSAPSCGPGDGFWGAPHP